MPEIVSPFASAVTENRWRPFSIRPLPNRAYRISEYPALQGSGFRNSAHWHVAYLTPYLLIDLSPFAMCPAFPDADYYEDSVALGLAPGRRSRVFRSSYVRAWVRPSTHPYARDHLPVSHRTGLPRIKGESATGGDAALSQRSGGAAFTPIGIGLEAV